MRINPLFDTHITQLLTTTRLTAIRVAFEAIRTIHSSAVDSGASRGQRHICSLHNNHIYHLLSIFLEKMSNAFALYSINSNKITYIQWRI